MSRDALIIGINRYSHRKLGTLASPAVDAEAIAQVLQQYGRFTTIRRIPEIIQDTTPQIDTEQTVTRKALREAITHLFNPTTKTQIPDTALLYFSGHGWQSRLPPADGYLASSNGDPDEDDGGVGLPWLRRQLETSPIRQQIIWLDCCNN